MISENILKYTNIPHSRLKILDNFYRKQNLEIKIEIFMEKRNKFFKLKNENPNDDLSTLDMAGFYIAIESFYELKVKVTKKNKTLCANDLKKYDNYLVKSFKNNNKISKKENSLLNKSSVLNSLILEGRSYREMSLFFKQYYKLDVSHTYIKQIIDKYSTIFIKKKQENYND